MKPYIIPAPQMDRQHTHRQPTMATTPMIMPTELFVSLTSTSPRASLVGPGEPLSYTAIMRLILSLFAFYLFLGVAAVAPIAAAGELSLYTFPTEGGTVAMRQMTEADGKVFQTIYYTLDPVRRDLQANPPAEHELIVQTVDLYTYDDTGQLSRTETMDAHGTPLRDLFTVYGDDGLLRAEILCTGQGVRQIERRFDTTEGESIASSVLQFDRTGEKLIAFSGRLPAAMDLASGWGPSDDVLVCGAAAFDPGAPLNEQTVEVTLQNIGAEPAQVATGPAFEVLEPELRDDRGRPVAPDTRVLEELAVSIAALSGGTALVQQPVPPGHGWTVGTFRLDQWYPALPSGRYTLVLRYRAAEGLIGLLCNEVELDIPVDEDTPNENYRGR